MTHATDPTAWFLPGPLRVALLRVYLGGPWPLLQLTTSLLQLQLQKSQYLQLGPSRGQYYGGSLPNVNQIGSGTVDLPFQVSPCPPTLAPAWGAWHCRPHLGHRASKCA